MGAYRSVVTLASSDDRAGLITAVYLVSYLSTAILALLAGIATSRYGLHDTALADSLASRRSPPWAPAASSSVEGALPARRVCAIPTRPRTVHRATMSPDRACALAKLTHDPTASTGYPGDKVEGF
jgi:hypothetical protein